MTFPATSPLSIPADPLPPRLATRTFETMGTVVGVSAPLAGEELDVLSDTLLRIFADADRRFSLYRPESELSRVSAGERSLPFASARLRGMYALALEWRNRTGGVFTPHGPDGVLDLNGVVKGWAIAAAGEALEELGVPHWAVNAGGDILCSGSPFPVPADRADPRGGTPWRAAIADPDDPQALVADLPLAGTPGTTAALATSGSAERGEHIWGGAGHSGSTGHGAAFRQVSVLGEDILTADVLATAIVAGGMDTLEHAVREWGVEVLAVAYGGMLLATPGWPRATREAG
ncbi:FAD:protein FMN transferase [Arthrobacter ginkgonis]